MEYQTSSDFYASLGMLWHFNNWIMPFMVYVQEIYFNVKTTFYRYLEKTRNTVLKILNLRDCFKNLS